MLWPHRIVVATFGMAVLVALAPSCSDELGANECETPGVSQDCTCPDGRVKSRICGADGTLSECYCYNPGCGNGQVDDGETCDDGNTASGDGCDSECMTEPGGPGGGNPVTSSSTGMGGMPATTTSGMGGMMGTGGMMSTGGMAGTGGAGGTGGA